MTDEVEISALDEHTTPLDGDLIVTVTDVGGGALVTKKMTRANFLASAGEKQVFLPVYKYINPADSSSVHYRPWNTSAHHGVILQTGVSTGNTGMVGIVPMDYSGNGKIIPIVSTFLGGTSGQYARFEYKVYVGNIGGTTSSRNGEVDYEYIGDVEIYRDGTSYWFVDMPEVILPTIYAGDIIGVEFARRGDHANDTFTGSLSVRGAIFSYT